MPAGKKQRNIGGLKKGETDEGPRCGPNITHSYVILINEKLGLLPLKRSHYIYCLS